MNAKKYYVVRKSVALLLEVVVGCTLFAGLSTSVDVIGQDAESASAALIEPQSTYTETAPEKWAFEHAAPAYLSSRNDTGISYPGIVLAEADIPLDVEETPVEEELPVEEPEEEPITFHLTRLDGVAVTDYDPSADYSALISETVEIALESNDPDTYLLKCELYECQRNLKILTEGIDAEQTHNFTADKTLEDIKRVFCPPYYDYTEEELIALARIVNIEAGWWFNTDEHQRAVASVVLNRTLSPDWHGDDIIEVIHWPGQYAAPDSKWYTDRSYANALYVLENGPITDGVYQAGFRQGDETLMVFAYEQDSEVTYICK